MTTLTEFLAAFFPDENETIYIRAFQAKGAPTTTDNRPFVAAIKRQRPSNDSELQKMMTAANKTRGWRLVVKVGCGSDADITLFAAFFGSLALRYVRGSVCERRHLCSFCRRTLPDNSIFFKGIAACPKCFRLSRQLVNNLRRHQREYSKRFGVKR